MFDCTYEHAAYCTSFLRRFWDRILVIKNENRMPRIEVNKGEK